MSSRAIGGAAEAKAIFAANSASLDEPRPALQIAHGHAPTAGAMAWEAAAAFRRQRAGRHTGGGGARRKGSGEREQGGLVGLRSPCAESAGRVRGRLGYRVTETMPNVFTLVKAKISKR